MNARSPLHTITLQFHQSNPDHDAYWEAMAVDFDGNEYHCSFSARDDSIQAVSGRLTAPLRPSELAMAKAFPRTQAPRKHHAICIEPTSPLLDAPDTWTWRCECGMERFGYATEGLAIMNGEVHLKEVKEWRRSRTPV